MLYAAGLPNGGGLHAHIYLMNAVCMCLLSHHRAGVLEAVRISCAGFPNKRPFPDFVDHFWPLAPELYHREDLDDR